MKNVVIRHDRESVMDLSVRIGALGLKSPIMSASGCFGYGTEYAGTVDLSSLGAVVVKGLFLAEREGHPCARRCRNCASAAPPSS
jgi:dihydroorotate dehydrogenase